MSNDRAIEVAVRAVYATSVAPGGDWDRQAAQNMIEALASAGFQITDLTPEEAKAVEMAAFEGQPVGDDLAYSGRAKLRALASSPSGGETR